MAETIRPAQSIADFCCIVLFALKDRAAQRS